MSVILPAFNEGHHLYANVAQVCAALRGHDFEVIVVDDGSHDATFSESQRAVITATRLVSSHGNKGKRSLVAISRQKEFI